MSISLIGFSAVVKVASGDLAFVCPTTQNNDIILGLIGARDNVSCGMPDVNYTKFNEVNQGTTTRLTNFWKRCTGDNGNFTITHTAGDAAVGVIGIYRGVRTSGNPYNQIGSQGNANSTTVTAPTKTTTVDGCQIIMNSAPRLTVTHSTWACATNPTTLNEQIDDNTTLGSDMSIGWAEAVQATQGATGTATCTISTSNQSCGSIICLEPAAAVIAIVALLDAQRRRE